MYCSLARRVARTMVYQAPQHTRPDASLLEALVSKHNWQRKQVQRDNAEFQDCCGEEIPNTSSKVQDYSPASELLSKDYKFRNFREAFAWMTKVAGKAEELKHHPEWSNVYNKVSVSLTTHSSNSTLTSLDVELAQACDEAEQEVIAARPPKRKAPAAA